MYWSLKKDGIRASQPQTWNLPSLGWHSWRLRPRARQCLTVHGAKGALDAHRTDDPSSEASTLCQQGVCVCQFLHSSRGRLWQTELAAEGWL